MAEQQSENPQLIDSVPGDVAPEPVDEVASTVARERYVPGYKVPRIGGPSDGVKYEPGMPIRLDADTNPQTGNPQVPKLRP